MASIFTLLAVVVFLYSSCCCNSECGHGSVVFSDWCEIYKCPNRLIHKLSMNL